MLDPHPGIIGPDGKENFLSVPKDMASTPAIKKNLRTRDAAMAEEEVIKKNGGDTREAHAAVLKAEGDLRASMVDEVIKTPEERRKEAATHDKRDAAEKAQEARSRRSQELDDANHPERDFDARFHPANADVQAPQPDRSADVRAPTTVLPGGSDVGTLAKEVAKNTAELAKLVGNFRFTGI